MGATSGADRNNGARHQPVSRSRVSAPPPALLTGSDLTPDPGTWHNDGRAAVLGTVWPAAHCWIRLLNLQTGEFARTLLDQLMHALLIPIYDSNNVIQEIAWFCRKTRLPQPPHIKAAPVRTQQLADLQPRSSGSCRVNFNVL